MLTPVILLAAWTLWYIRSCRGWRRCIRTGVWWHKSQPSVTYVNQPEQCRALPVWRKL